MLDDHESRRDFLKCMAWAGTGALFAFDGGIGSSMGLDSALAAPPIIEWTYDLRLWRHLGIHGG